MNNVTVQVKGVQYTGAKSYSISKSLSTLSGSFEMTFASDGSSNLKPTDIETSDELKIFIDGNLFMTCLVDDISQSDVDFTLSARENSSIIIDSSVNVEELSNVSFDTFMGRMLDPFKINYELSSKISKKYSKIKFNSSEKVYEAILKRLRDLNLIMVTLPSGNIQIIKPKTSESLSNIIYGYNIRSFEVKQSGSDRFSSYTVRSKNSSKGRSWETTSFFTSGTSKDDGVKIYKPLIITSEENLSNAECVKRAEYEKALRLNKSQNISVTLEGFYQTDKPFLWELNLLSLVKIPKAKVDNFFLIKTVSFRKDMSGSFSDLELCPRGAFHNA